MVTYWFWREQSERKFEQTFAAVHRCLTRTPADRHHHAYVIWGNALVVQRQFDEAEKKYSAAASLAPHFASTYNSWGILRRAVRRLDEAAAMHRKAIHRDHRQGYLWGNLGNVYNDQHKYRAAACRYRRAVRLDPSYANAWSGWGYALWKLGRYGEAEAKFAWAIDLDPDYGWSYLNWAQLLRLQHRYEEAVAKARVAAKPTAIPAQAYAVCGDILVDAGQFSEAAELYRLATKADPDLGNGPAGLARLRRLQGRHDEAIRAAEESLGVNRYHTGMPVAWTAATTGPGSGWRRRWSSAVAVTRRWPSWKAPSRLGHANLTCGSNGEIC